jgi:hypothetical protein
LNVLELLQSQGYAAVPAHQFNLPEEPGQQQLQEAYDDLQPDLHMADGGRYRLRRFGRFRLHHLGLTPDRDNSIYQELKDNPLNGGVRRFFAPLTEPLWQSPFLRALILQDARTVGLDWQQQDWHVGVHCVRILARPNEPGKPTPEGVHRDAERYTVQHLIARQSVRGGVFSAYDQHKRPVFHWLQLQPWDTLFFCGSTWHSATPIHSDEGGHRDILLIDFDPIG